MRMIQARSNEKRTSCNKYGKGTSAQPQKSKSIEADAMEVEGADILEMMLVIRREGGCRYVSVL